MQLPNLQALVGRFAGGARLSTSKDVTKFKKTLSHTDWWDTDLESSSGEIACYAGKWTRIGQYTVPAQQLYRFGSGDEEHPENQGYLYLAIYDDTVTNSVLEEGLVRLIQTNANETVTVTVFEERTENLRGDTADKRKKIALPEQDHLPWVGEDSKLCIEFKPDADDDVIKTAVGTAAGLDIWNIPVTIKQ